MNAIVQHIPSYVDGFKQLRESFTSIEQLLEIPFVKSWTDDKDFYRLSTNDGCLIAELRGGRVWYVVGFLLEPVPELPEWNRGIYQVLDANGELLEISGEMCILVAGTMSDFVMDVF